MTKFRNREEVVNTQLAVLISKLGVTADAETIHVHGEHRPDVLFQLRGLRVIIEGKFADHAGAERVVLEDLRKRVRSGLAHIAAAAIYPNELRTTSTSKILDVLRTTQLKYRIVAETHESNDWFEGTPASLMEALRRAQEALVEDDIVDKTAKALSVQLQGIAALWMGQSGACDRLSNILGISIAKGEKSEKAEERRETAAKVSALVLANALIFQEQLAATDGRHHAEIVLCVGVSLCSRQPIPFDCFVIVLRDASAVFVHHAEKRLRVGVSLCSKRFEQLQQSGVVASVISLCSRPYGDPQKRQHGSRRA